MKKTVQLKGLDCAHCAAELEEQISKIAGVSAASVAFVNQKLTVEYDTEETFKKVLYTANHFEEVRVVEDMPEKEKQAGRYAANEKKSFVKEWICIGVSMLFLGLGFLLQSLIKNTLGAWLGYACFAIAYFSVGYPVLIATGKNIVKGKIFDENFLMTLASVGAVLLGEIGEGVLVMLLYEVGETLQAIAVGASRKSVSKLVELKSEFATLLVGGEQKQVAPEEIKAGDILLVKAGEKVPVDGILLTGEAQLDTKSLTGEAELRTARVGNELLAGYINAGGVLKMQALRPYEDSAVGKILDMVENAASGKAAPEKFITKFAKYYTPIVCGLALIVALFAPLAWGLIADRTLCFKDFARFAKAALTFLVISCPCALIISVPLSYFSGVGACAKQGALVKGATYLDVIAKTKIAAFDKTGTLTEGNFTVCEAYPMENVEKTELLALAAAVEKQSSHPIAKAFKRIKSGYMAENATEIAGRGVKAEIDGACVLVGNGELLKENGVSYTPFQSAYTTVYVAKNSEYLGVIEIGDKLRAEAKTVLGELKKLGVSRTVMLTGDGAERAQKIAKAVGMYETKAELLPDQKLKAALKLKEEGTLLYVGDGINDAPVMTVADCAVSMGKLGSAAAVEASDVVLISDNLKALPKCVKIARKTRRIVLQNIVFSIVMKVAFMALGAVGILPLALAVFADVGVMLLAVANSFRVRY